MDSLFIDPATTEWLTTEVKRRWRPDIGEDAMDAQDTIEDPASVTPEATSRHRDDLSLDRAIWSSALCFGQKCVHTFLIATPLPVFIQIIFVLALMADSAREDAVEVE